MSDSDSENEVLDARELLAASKQKAQSSGSSEMLTEDIDFDLGNLMASYGTAMDPRAMKSKREGVILKHARWMTQQLVNQLFELPTSREDFAVMAALPDGKTQVPREKSVPEKAPETRWQQFARENNIRKKKRSRMVWDEEAKEWRPRYGYKRAGSEQDDWLLPSLPGDGDDADPFYQKAKKRKAVVDKQKDRELRNVKEQLHREGKTLPTTLVAQLEGSSKFGKKKDELEVQFNAAQRSTASMGNFDRKLNKEKKVKTPGKRRQFDATTKSNLKGEKESNLHVLDKVLRKAPEMHMEKAINKFQQENERKGKGGLAAAEMGKKGRKGGKGGKGKRGRR